MAANLGRIRAQNTRARSAASGVVSEIELDSGRFMRSLVAHLAALNIASEKALQVTGVQIQNKARQLAPVDTGRLRASIFSRAGRDSRGYYIDVGSNVEYAAYVEFGTYRMAAQPYLRPAIALATGYMSSAVQ